MDMVKVAHQLMHQLVIAQYLAKGKDSKFQIHSLFVIGFANLNKPMENAFLQLI
jgi:hypothetical protein